MWHIAKIAPPDGDALRILASRRAPDSPHSEYHAKYALPPRHVTGGTPSYLAVSEDRLMAGEEARWFHLPPEEGVIFLPYCASRCPHLRGAICAVTVLFPRWSSELV